MYDETYYKSINYTNYLSRKPRYRQLAIEVTNLLKKLNLIVSYDWSRTTNDLQQFPNILDFGCATGMLVGALNEIGCSAYGYDISDYALGVAKEVGLEVYNEIEQIRDMPKDVTFLLDVLEHIPATDLDENLKAVTSSDAIIFRIPVCLEEGEPYHLEVSRNDPTHVTCWTKERWTEFFARYGYTIMTLDLHTIYDSPGVFCGLGVKR
jgi:SAM-dependent methyltransferase